MLEEVDPHGTAVLVAVGVAHVHVLQRPVGSLLEQRKEGACVVDGRWKDLAHRVGRGVFPECEGLGAIHRGLTGVGELVGDDPRDRVERVRRIDDDVGVEVVVGGSQILVVGRRVGATAHAGVVDEVAIVLRARLDGRLPEAPFGHQRLVGDDGRVKHRLRHRLHARAVVGDANRIRRRDLQGEAQVGRPE